MLRIGIVVGCCVGASGWLAWWYKVVQYHIESVSYFLELWMDIIKLHVMNINLTVFNTCKHYILFCWELVLWWVVLLEQAGGLHGNIRWFNIILGVFLIFWNCGWILFSYFCMIILLFFSILVNFLYCDVDYWYWVAGVTMTILPMGVVHP